jgi:hypothetical protein
MAIQTFTNSSAHVFIGTAGAAISFGQCVYFDTVSSKYKLAKADVVATADAVAICNEAAGIAENATGSFCLGQMILTTGSFTKGLPVYLSAATAGALTTCVGYRGEILIWV